MSNKADQIVRLEEGVRYDVPSLEARVVRVSWTEGDGYGTDGYDWGSYFADDGTYKGTDWRGIEPEFWISGDEPVTFAKD